VDVTVTSVGLGAEVYTLA